MNKKNETLKETFLAALEHYKKKDYKTVEIYCYKILNIDPNHVSSISMLATISAVNRNFVKAKELLNKAIKIEPNNINVIQNLGTTYKELGQYTEAIKYYKKVLEINPNHTNAHYSLGLVFYLLNDLKKAKSFLIKTIGIQKNYGLAFFVLANIHVDLKEYNKAVSCYQKAIELNPNLVGAHNNLGLVFRTLNDFERAINCYQQAITIKNNNAGAHHNLALTFKDIGRFEEAIKSHEMAIKYEPDNLAHYHFLTELKKDILNSNLKKKIEKILSDKKCSNSNNAYGNYLLSKYEKKEKNYEKEFNFLIKGHKNFFSTREKKFELGVKYCFVDVLQISKDLEIDQIDKKKYDEMKPIFIVGVPRCGSTLVEKIIGSGKQSISIGEETAILENFINKKILEKQSLNLA